MAADPADTGDGMHQGGNYQDGAERNPCGTGTVHHGGCREGMQNDCSIGNRRFHTNAVGVCDGLLEGLPGITGISCDKVLGRIWLQMVFSEDRDRVCMEWYQSIIRNRVLAVAFRVAESAVGEQKEVSCSLSPELSDCNKTIGYYGVLIHVNEHDQAATTWARRFFDHGGRIGHASHPVLRKRPKKFRHKRIHNRAFALKENPAAAHVERNEASPL